MSTITVYAFETHGDESATEWTTQDFQEAVDYARQNGYSLIARDFEYTDSSLVEDFRPGHALDGTTINDHVCGEDDKLTMFYYPWDLEVAASRGWDREAHATALESGDIDAISLTHPTNWLTEAEVEAHDA